MKHEGFTPRPCDMKAGCRRPVTHSDEKGFVYCTEHAKLRRSSGMKCPRLPSAATTALLARVAELEAENERLRALLARTAAFVDVEILKHNTIGEDLRAAVLSAKR